MRRLKILSGFIVFGLALVAAFAYRRHSDDPLAGFLSYATKDETSYYELTPFPSMSVAQTSYIGSTRWLVCKPITRPQVEAILRQIESRPGWNPVFIDRMPLYSASISNGETRITAAPVTNDVGVPIKYKGGNVFNIQVWSKLSRWDIIWLRIRHLGRDPIQH